MLQEFDLIERHFKPLCKDNPGMILGMGDDAALLNIPPNETLAISTDTLIAGTHFPFETSPEDIAYKALMVNASDLAAMGAAPRWFLLALTLPDSNPVWLNAFAKGLADALESVQAVLIGGDTTKGPLSITIQALGTLQGKALLRSGAKVGDLIFVTGKLGAAAFALTPEGKQNAAAQTALNRPQARWRQGKILQRFASSAIDVSDGLAQDLGHVLKASGVGAQIFLKDVPIAECLTNDICPDSLELALSGGDDYELLCTLSPENVESAKSAFLKENMALFQIGTIVEKQGLNFIKENGEHFLPDKLGYDHFRSDGK